MSEASSPASSEVIMRGDDEKILCISVVHMQVHQLGGTGIASRVPRSPPTIGAYSTPGPDWCVLRRSAPSGRVSTISERLAPLTRLERSLSGHRPHSGFRPASTSPRAEHRSRVVAVHANLSVGGQICRRPYNPDRLRFVRVAGHQWPLDEAELCHLVISYRLGTIARALAERTAALRSGWAAYGPRSASGCRWQSRLDRSAQRMARESRYRLATRQKRLLLAALGRGWVLMVRRGRRLWALILGMLVLWVLIL